MHFCSHFQFRTLPSYFSASSLFHHTHNHNHNHKHLHPFSNVTLTHTNSDNSARTYKTDGLRVSRTLGKGCVIHGQQTKPWGQGKECEKAVKMLVVLRHLILLSHTWCKQLNRNSSFSPPFPSNYPC